MLLKQDNAVLNTAIQGANRICYVKQQSQYHHTGAGGVSSSPLLIPP